jgi:hypothetical protein
MQHRVRFRALSRLVLALATLALSTASCTRPGRRGSRNLTHRATLGLTLPEMVE